MRKDFANELYKAMKKNENIWLLTGDLGFGILENIRDKFPKRFINCGASEQAMMGIACGLALEGKIPFLGIPRILERVMKKHSAKPRPSLADILEADLWSREEAEKKP